MQWPAIRISPPLAGQIASTVPCGFCGGRVSFADTSVVGSIDEVWHAFGNRASLTREMVETVRAVHSLSRTYALSIDDDASALSSRRSRAYGLLVAPILPQNLKPRARRNDRTL